MTRVTLILLLVFLVVGVAQSADSTRRLPPKLQKELKGLSAEERRARIQRYHKEHGGSPLSSKEREKLRKELEGLSPKERKERIHELRRARIREKWEGRSREDWEKRKAELKKLSPEDREKKIRQWRSEGVGHRHDLKKFTPSERTAKRDQMRARMEKEMETLAAKGKNGELTDKEKRRLRHLKELSKRFERKRTPGGEPEKRRNGGKSRNR